MKIISVLVVLILFGALGFWCFTSIRALVRKIKDKKLDASVSHTLDNNDKENK